MSPIGGTADLPPPAEGHDAELTLKITLRPSGSLGPVEPPAAHGPRDRSGPPGPDGWNALGGAWRARAGRRRRDAEPVADARATKARSRKLVLSEIGGGWCRQRQCAGRVAHPGPRLIP